MKKAFKFAFALLCCAVLFVSCSKNYGDDIDALDMRVSALESTVSALQSQINAGAVITDVTAVTGGVKVTLSNGNSFTITNGKDGQNGRDGVDGQNGRDGVDGKDGSVVTIGDNGHWFIDGVDTGLAAQGPAGQDGRDGIDGQDGRDGQDGQDGQDGKDGKDGVYYVPNAETGCFDKVDPSTDPATVTPTQISFLAPGTITAVYGEDAITFFNVKGYEGGLVINLAQEIGYISLYSDELTPYGKNWGEYTVTCEKDNEFVAPDGGKYVFTNGRNVIVAEDYIIVRVSPTNAKLDPEKIHFIDSKGNNLDNIIKVKGVEPWDAMLVGSYTTKGNTLNTGLYKIKTDLQDVVTADAFNKATTYETTTRIYQRLFAVAVDNAKGGQAISGYNVEFYRNEDDAHVDFNNLTVNGKNILDIHNRYTRCEEWKSDQELLKPEMVWIGEAAVKPILEPAAKKNVIEGDDRYAPNKILPVVKGEPIKIAFGLDADGKVAQKIKGFYVELDTAKAISSFPSEINAWKSYQYKNLGTLIDGNVGEITVEDMNGVAGDVIGFRVHAVNLDGTLVAPYGRAFYVQVGDPASTREIKAVELVANKVAVESDYIDVTDVFENCTSIQNWKLVNGDEDITGQQPFTITYYDKDKHEVNASAYGSYSTIKYVKISTANIANYVDGKTYTQMLTLLKKDENTGIDFILRTIKATVTKVMPTACETLAFKPVQSPDGVHYDSYMIPTDGYRVNTLSTTGYKELKNVFETIKTDVFLKVANAAKNTRTGKYTETLVVDGTNNWNLVVDAALVGKPEEHAVVVYQNYPQVSRPNAKSAVSDYVTTNNQTFQFTFKCWEQANKYEWAENAQPVLQWTNAGNTVRTNLSEIIVKNSYDNDNFGGNLAELLTYKGYLAIDTDKDVTLTVDGQLNPYFKASIERQFGPWGGMRLVFTQVNVQVDSAPIADHDEVLTFSVKDSFGHSTEISVDVTIKAPEKR